MTVVTKWHYTDWDVRCNTIATKERGGEERRGRNKPTGFSSIMDWALVRAADMAAGEALEAKKRRRNEMMGKVLWGFERK